MWGGWLQKGVAATEHVAYAFSSAFPLSSHTPCVCLCVLCLSSWLVFLFAFVAFDAVRSARKLKLLQWHREL